jgi:hypothetical protein
MPTLRTKRSQTNARLVVRLGSPEEAVKEAKEEAVVVVVVLLPSRRRMSVVSLVRRRLAPLHKPLRRRNPNPKRRWMSRRGKEE